MRPNLHLRELIARASSDEQARAMAKARAYLLMCRRLEIDPLPAERIYAEALEIVMQGEDATSESELHRRHDYYVARTYARNYSEQ
jgi:hypothetical protein